MSARRTILGAALALCALTVTPRPAAADWTLTPFVGANFASNVDFNNTGNAFEDQAARRVDFGASLGWMGQGIVGAEIDFGYSPNFYENAIVPGGTGGFGNSNVATLMGNLIVGVPVGGQTGPGVRPYVVGGLGLMRSHINGGDFFNDLNANELGFDVGGGIQGFFSDNFGLRGDVRYFRALTDTNGGGTSLRDIGLSNFNFWRATMGVVIRFGQ